LKEYDEVVEAEDELRDIFEPEKETRRGVKRLGIDSFKALRGDSVSSSSTFVNESR
jgi:hypothetical protein